MSNRRKPGYLRKQKNREKKTRPQMPKGPAHIQVSIPESEKTLLKEVPAKIDGDEVGVAYIYDDGSVDIVYDNRLTEEHRAKIEGTMKDLRVSMREDLP